jgi:hypothetical protein
VRATWAIVAAVLLSACSVTPQQTDAVQKGLAYMTPQGAARYDYDKAVADYQNCLTANPSNASACEGQRRIMEADAQVLSAAVSPGTTVYVPPAVR